MSKQFYFMQLCLALVRRLNIKTVLFQVIQFSISTHFSSIWPIDKTILGATTPGFSGLESDGNEGVICIPESSSIMEPHHQIILYHIHDTRWGVLPVCKDAFGVFYIPANWTR